VEMIRTLIVEDDSKIAEIQHVFTEKVEGFTVVGIANSIGEADEIVSVLEPDLILLDIFFPDGSGLDFLWKIRGRQEKSDVVLITAAKEVRFFEDAMRGGAFDYILKPLVFSRFSATLEKYREHRQKLKCIKTISQKDVDRLLHQSGTAAVSRDGLPKGIDPITLEKVTVFLENNPEQWVSAEAAGRELGFSRTTSRRYLEYLVASGVIIADLVYGTQGRPERVYRVKVSD